MPVMVTGGAGYIGSHMVLTLLDAGEDVVVVDNLVTGFRSAVDARATFVHADIGELDQMAALIREHGIDEIIHFAGSVVVPESVSDPLKYYRNNTAASRNLLEAAVAGGVKRFVFSSTAAVYGMAGERPVPESAPLNPISPYGRSKLMTEHMLADVSAVTDLQYGVLRYFNVAGADPDGRAGQSTAGATHLIKVAVQVALGIRGRLEVYGTDYPTRDGTGVRDYIHVTDLVGAHAAVLDKMRSAGGCYTFNCGYGRGLSVREIIEAVERAAGRPLNVIDSPRRPGDPAFIVANVDHMRDSLSWEPSHDQLDNIIRSALAWEKRILEDKQGTA